jgi:two-component system, OmpR family, response regulator ResD
VRIFRTPYEMRNSPAGSLRRGRVARDTEAVESAAAPQILVVDDEPIVRDVVCKYLERESFRTIEAADGDEALRVLLAEDVQLVVLDVMLPSRDGLELCRWIRARSDLPVIMLTGRGELTDRIVGLELGADDYVAKPFSPRELVARIRTVLRRAAPGASADGRIELPDLTVDAATREVLAFGEPVELTMREFDLIEFLARHPRQVFSRDQLMEAVWGYRSARDTGTVTVHIRRLREKLERNPSRPQRLQTVWGVGYRFVP